MTPPKSKVWRYFTRKKGNVVSCNNCFKNLKSSGNTTNLRSHLKQKHGEIYKLIEAHSGSITENIEKHNDDQVFILLFIKCI